MATQVTQVALAALIALTAAGCPVERGLDCSEEATCASELACEPRGDGTSVCVPPEGEQRQLREPCRESALCGPGVVCIERAGGVSLCLIEDGQFCFGNDECISNDCESRCGNTAICDVGISCPCARDDDCGDGEACAGSECGRTCDPAGARGEVCLTRVEGPCDFRKGCGDELACAVELGALEDGVCLPPAQRASGEVCNRPEECASDVCTDGACA